MSILDEQIGNLREKIEQCRSKIFSEFDEQDRFLFENYLHVLGVAVDKLSEKQYPDVEFLSKQNEILEELDLIPQMFGKMREYTQRDKELEKKCAKISDPEKQWILEQRRRGITNNLYGYGRFSLRDLEGAISALGLSEKDINEQLKKEQVTNDTSADQGASVQHSGSPKTSATVQAQIEAQDDENLWASSGNEAKKRKFAQLDTAISSVNEADTDEAAAIGSWVLRQLNNMPNKYSSFSAEEQREYERLTKKAESMLRKHGAPVSGIVTLPGFKKAFDEIGIDYVDHRIDAEEAKDAGNKIVDILGRMDLHGRDKDERDRIVKEMSVIIQSWGQDKSHPSKPIPEDHETAGFFSKFDKDKTVCFLDNIIPKDLVIDVDRIVQRLNELANLLRKQRTGGTNGNLVVQGNIVHIKGQGKAIFVGDIHGDTTGIRKILQETDFVEKAKNKENIYLVFLGDYVDRQDKVDEQFRALEALINLKMIFPNNVVLLRGNHDLFAGCASPQEIIAAADMYADFCNKRDKASKQGSEISGAYFKMCNELPFAAVTDAGDFGVHGGIPVGKIAINGSKNTADIENETVLLKDIEDAKVDDLKKRTGVLWELVWNDPNSDTKIMLPNTSPRDGNRKTIWEYTKTTVDAFLLKNKLTRIIRSHEAGSFRDIYRDGKVIRIYSNVLDGDPISYLVSDISQILAEQSAAPKPKETIIPPPASMADGEIKDKVLTLIYESDFLYEQGVYDKAEEKLNEAQKIIDEKGIDTTEKSFVYDMSKNTVLALLYSSDMLYELGKYIESEEKLNEAEDLIKKGAIDISDESFTKTMTKNKVLALIYVSDNLYELGEYAKAEEKLNEAEDLINKYNLRDMVIPVGRSA